MKPLGFISSDLDFRYGKSEMFHQASNESRGIIYFDHLTGDQHRLVQSAVIFESLVFNKYRFY